MVVNGRDPLAGGSKPQDIPPRKGKRHLMRLLETLARVEAIENSSLVSLIQQQRYQLAWGTTLIVITGMVSDQLMAELYQARRSGQSAVLILAGRDAPGDAARGRAKAFGVPVFRIATQGDLDTWMRGSRRA
jgi:uncharacterized protein (DUF58 family)